MDKCTREHLQVSELSDGDEGCNVFVSYNIIMLMILLSKRCWKTMDWR